MPTKEEAALLDLVRSRPCRLCRRPQQSTVHHVRAKGIGGGNELNHPLNLMPLCNRCHRVVHDEGTYGVLMLLVAADHGMDFDEAKRRVRDALQQQRDA